MASFILPRLFRAQMAVLVLLISLLCSATAGTSQGGGSVVVTSGQSIQAAINAAPAGQVIFIEAGTYAEQLTIKTNGVQLVSKGAVLVPPKTFTANTCSGLAGNGTEAGICITGSGVKLADFVVEHRKVLSVGKPVANVLVAGFQIQNFTGLNIAVVGGLDVQVIGNTLHDGSQYGALTVGSKNTHIDANSVASTGSELLFIAVCMDDTAGVRITNNEISGYYVGLCVQTNKAFVANNRVTDTCWGVFVDPEIQGAQILNNYISAPAPVCSTFDGGAVLGVTLSGASGTLVKGNLVAGMKAGNASVPNIPVAGVAIFDDTMTGTGALAKNNTVAANLLVNNTLDVLLYTNGTGNVVQGNQCKTPASLCG